jgi:transposase InsO family protein
MLFFYPFKKWKELVENETGKSLKCLRSDNGGEYCSKEFDDYFSYHGIRREKTVSGTPQENGVTERMNRTIMECARSMRLHVDFPLQF